MATATVIGDDREPPCFTLAEAARLAQHCFGLSATAAPLPGDRDQNFLLHLAGEPAFVLKLAAPGEDADLLAAQNAALHHLQAHTPYRFPQPVAAVSGALIERVAAGGREHLARLLTYVPGTPLARVPRHAPALLRAVGRLLGATDRALLDFVHPATHRALHWDLQHGRAVIERHVHIITDPARRALLQHFVALFDAHAADTAALRTSVIHGDGNDWNVLVDVAADPLSEPQISGLLDLGDIVHSWLAAEPAIACAYAMLDKRDPLAAAAHVVRGYHTELPLEEAEIALLFPLIGLRLCTSVVLAAVQRSSQPDNEYLSISEAPAWSLLQRLRAVPPRYAHYLFRDVCGLEPCPQTPAIVQWLRQQQHRCAPVLDPDPRTTRSVVFDFSVGTTEFPELRGRTTAAAWSEVIFRRLREAGASTGIGRYDEPRGWYTGDAFRIEAEDGFAWRTVHLGIDLFAAAGTAVHAPLPGVVHAVQDNAGALDYGPTIILRHEFDDIVCFTLYGHLAGNALHWRVGERVEAGQHLADIGDCPRNGDWAPHLHLQLITDLLDYDGTFPGVAAPTQRNVWRSLSPDPNLLLDIAALATPARAPLDTAELAARRASHLGRNLSVSYQRPLHIVRGWMQHLYDADGQVYLDCVNNVPHVGHSHPDVLDALLRQSAVLNTNTRYLHETIVRYAERLTSLLPAPLSVCFFVNSGSEANELALRLARAYTGRRDFIVLDAAYHGNTGALVDLSPYKFAGAGGAGAPDTTHVVPLPDPYRGPHRGAHHATGTQYAQYVQQTVAECIARDRAVAALLVESLPGCGGQIVLPAGFLEAAFAHVRAAGGVTIADEVQVGFGRVGTHFWGFETQHVVPDIVTMGKPIGNGHPLGAVVTTPEIAAAFANGMEYFNTFGGNPVSCAVGMAVLDVIAAEQLQQHALTVGNELQSALRTLAERHELIGDVRGRGLYIGIELVRDRTTLEPAPRHATCIVERMRAAGILLSIDGPHHNVIKLKPPLPFSSRDAERVASTLDRVLAELAR